MKVNTKQRRPWWSHNDNVCDCIEYGIETFSDIKSKRNIHTFNIVIPLSGHTTHIDNLINLLMEVKINHRKKAS